MSLFALGPDPDFREQPSGAPAEAFSTCLKGGPFPLRRPDEYACGKAHLFPAEGGAAIIELEVPDAIVTLAEDKVYLPLSGGVVQFDAGRGLHELIKAWPKISKQVIPVKCP
jgi:hypothetical protein